MQGYQSAWQTILHTSLYTLSYSLTSTGLAFPKTNINKVIESDSLMGNVGNNAEDARQGQTKIQQLKPIAIQSRQPPKLTLLLKSHDPNLIQRNHNSFTAVIRQSDPNINLWDHFDSFKAIIEYMKNEQNIQIIWPNKLIVEDSVRESNEMAVQMQILASINTKKNKKIPIDTLYFKPVQIRYGQTLRSIAQDCKNSVNNNIQSHMNYIGTIADVLGQVYAKINLVQKKLNSVCAHKDGFCKSDNNKKNIQEQISMQEQFEQYKSQMQDKIKRMQNAFIGNIQQIVNIFTLKIKQLGTTKPNTPHLDNQQYLQHLQRRILILQQKQIDHSQERMQEDALFQSSLIPRLKKLQKMFILQQVHDKQISQLKARVEDLEITASHVEQKVVGCKKELVVKRELIGRVINRRKKGNKHKAKPKLKVNQVPITKKAPQESIKQNTNALNNSCNPQPNIKIQQNINNRLTVNSKDNTSLEKQQSEQKNLQQIGNNVKSEQIQQHPLGSQIEGTSWPDPKSSHYTNLQLSDNAIVIKNQWSDIFGRKQITGRYEMTVKFTRIKQFGGIGIVDRAYRTLQVLGQNQVNRISYWSHHGTCYIGLKCKSKKSNGFKQGDSITMIMDDQQGTIQWRCNGEIRQKLQSSKIKDQSICWVGYIFLEDQGDCVEIVSC